jgi:hypothetical protein
MAKNALIVHPVSVFRAEVTSIPKKNVACSSAIFKNFTRHYITDNSNSRHKKFILDDTKTTTSAV